MKGNLPETGIPLVKEHSSRNHSKCSPSINTNLTYANFGGIKPTERFLKELFARRLVGYFSGDSKPSLSPRK